MKRKDRVRDEVEDRFYPVFSGFQVKIKNKKADLEQHFVVSWQMMHDKCKKFAH